MKPYSPHPPSQKQRAFLELDAQEALYGGAAGGGKSDALIMGALQFVDVPGYSALLMRRRDVDLHRDGAILDRARKWFAGTAAEWDDKLGGFRFPSTATISFGHLSRYQDRDKWKGPEYQYIGVDEITDWEEGDYLFMFSRLRGLRHVNIPTRMRGATNPGGAGHDWVFDRFVRHSSQAGSGADYDSWRKGDRTGQPYFESPATAQSIDLARTLGVVAQGAYFVPAFPEDNPALNVAEYRMNLAKLDPVEYAWFAEGDWTAVPSGRFFERQWFQYLDEEPTGVTWIRYWDLAATDADELGKNGQRKDPAWTAGVRLGIEHNLKTKSNRLVIADARRDRKNPGEVEEFVLMTANQDGKRVPIVIEQEPGSTGKSSIFNWSRKVLFGWNVQGDKKTGPKDEMWRGLAGLARNGGVYLVRGPWNESFVKELITLPVGKKDQADAASGGYAWLIGPGGGLARLRLLASM